MEFFAGWEGGRWKVDRILWVEGGHLGDGIQHRLVFTERAVDS
jgi:hypothetical protein